VCKALGIQFGDSLEDSILAGKISFLNAVLTTTKSRTPERLLRANDISFSTFAGLNPAKKIQTDGSS